MVNHRSILASIALILVVSSLSQAQTAEVIADGIVRFDASHDARINRRPSIAMVRQFESIGDIDPASHALAPTFSTNDDGRFVAAIKIEAHTSLYGTGQVAGPLLRNGFVTETWNYDAFG